MSISSEDPVHSGPGVRLLLMRHAKAAYPDACTDHERPLAGRGRNDSPIVGAWLADVGWIPDLVICSDAARTIETADLVVSGLGRRTPPPVRPEAELYEAGVETVLSVVADTPPGVRTLLVVGHEPIMSASTGAICGKYAHFPTGTVAQIELPDGFASIAPGVGRLVAVHTPKD